VSEQPQRTPPPQSGTSTASEAAISVVSAYGLFRVLLVLLAVWTFFAGFSLLTRGLGALSLGADNEAAERIIGAHMLMLVPVYALLVWRRQAYRFFVWVPYAAQLAIVVPALWELVLGDHEIGDGALLYIVSTIFLVMLVYVSLSSKQLTGEFIPDGDEDEEWDEEDEDGEPLEDEEEEDDLDAEAPARGVRRAPSHPRRYRRT
jgi:hypothetical protein